MLRTWSLAISVAACIIGAAGDAVAYTVYVSNEKDNSITVIDSATLEVKHTIPVGQRPRGIMLTKDGKSLLICASDDDEVQILDLGTEQIVGTLPSGPDPEPLNIHPSGSPVYIANEDDALMTAIDLEQRKVIAEVPVGVEPEGIGISPDGKTLIATSETSSISLTQIATRSPTMFSSNHARATPNSPPTARCSG